MNQPSLRHEARSGLRLGVTTHPKPLSAKLCFPAPPKPIWHHKGWREPKLLWVAVCPILGATPSHVPRGDPPQSDPDRACGAEVLLSARHATQSKRNITQPARCTSRTPPCTRTRACSFGRGDKAGLLLGHVAARIAPTLKCGPRDRGTEQKPRLPTSTSPQAVPNKFPPRLETNNVGQATPVKLSPGRWGALQHRAAVGQPRVCSPLARGASG